MLYEFLVFMFVTTAILLTVFILIQKTKGSMGLGSMGGGSQMLFGGSGGQDFMQKATWVLGILFMFGSLGIALLRTKQSETSRYILPKTELPNVLEKNVQTATTQSEPVRAEPVQADALQQDEQQKQEEETENTPSKQ
jgi:protein translocase SecG subunit